MSIAPVQARPTFPTTSQTFGVLTVTAEDLGTHYCLVVQNGGEKHFTALNYQTADYGNLTARIAFLAHHGLAGTHADDIVAIINRQNIRAEFEDARRRNDKPRMAQLEAADIALMTDEEKAFAADVRQHIAEVAGINDEARRDNRNALRRDVAGILSNSTYSPYRGFRRGGAR